MEMYSTDDDYTLIQINKLVKWFNINIGTEYEISESENEYYAIFVDMTYDEMNALRRREIMVRKQWKKDKLCQP